MSDEAGIGHNSPPADPFLVRLEEDHAKLIVDASDLEIESFDLPEKVTTDDHVTAITAYVVKLRDYGRTVEKARKEAGEEPLKMTRTINSFFGPMRDNAVARAAEIEKRSTAFLAEKRRQQEAQAKEAAERAAALRAEEEARAREAREAQEAARKAAEEASARAAEAARKAAEAKDAEAKAAAEAEAAKAADESRKAAEEITRQAEAAQEADKAAQAHGKTEKRAEAIVEGGGVLAQPGAAGGVKVKKVWTAIVSNKVEMIRSLGPLGPFLPEAQIEAALDRAAKGYRPAIPGVTYKDEDEVKTSARKAK